MRTICTKIIPAGLLLGMVAAYGCGSSVGDLEVGKPEQIKGTTSDDKNIIVVDDGSEPVTEDVKLARELDLTAVSGVSDRPPGKCCFALCNGWHKLWWVDADCNGKAAAWCASHNLSLKDADWKDC